MTTCLTMTRPQVMRLQSAVSHTDDCEQKKTILAKIKRNGFNLTRSQTEWLSKEIPSLSGLFHDGYRFQKSRKDDWCIVVL